MSSLLHQSLCTKRQKSITGFIKKVSRETALLEHEQTGDQGSATADVLMGQEPKVDHNLADEDHLCHCGEENKKVEDSDAEKLENSDNGDCSNVSRGGIQQYLAQVGCVQGLSGHEEAVNHCLAAADTVEYKLRMNTADDLPRPLDLDQGEKAVDGSDTEKLDNDEDSDNSKATGGSIQKYFSPLKNKLKVNKEIDNTLVHCGETQNCEVVNSSDLDLHVDGTKTDEKTDTGFEKTERDDLVKLTNGKTSSCEKEQMGGAHGTIDADTIQKTHTAKSERGVFPDNCTELPTNQSNTLSVTRTRSSVVDFISSSKTKSCGVDADSPSRTKSGRKRKRNNSKQSPRTKVKEYFCPVCNEVIEMCTSLTLFNQHIDLCIETQSVRTAGQSANSKDAALSEECSGMDNSTDTNGNMAVPIISTSSEGSTGNDRHRTINVSICDEGQGPPDSEGSVSSNINQGFEHKGINNGRETSESVKQDFKSSTKDNLATAEQSGIPHDRGNLKQAIAGSSGTGNQKQTRVSETEGEAATDSPETFSFLVCPVCNVEQRTFNLDVFNSHVDTCLNKGAISQMLKEQRKSEDRTKRPISDSIASSQPASKKKRSSTEPVKTKSILSFFK